MLLVFNISENSVIFDEGYEIHKVRNMKRTFFYLAAAVMTALTFTACEKGEQDEPDVKKPSIEEVLRLDDILYKPGDIVDVDVMTAQYKKIGYELYMDKRAIFPGLDILYGTVYYRSERYNNLILHSMAGNSCHGFIYASGLFTYDMKDDVIRYINNRFNITLERSEEPDAYLPDIKDVYHFSDGINGFTLRLKDASCEFSFGRLDIFE